MTRLELAICEAENSGEIDIYTRDMMLDMINESTAQTKHSKTYTEVNALAKKYDDIKREFDDAYRKMGECGDKKTKHEYMKKMERAKADMSKIEREIKKYMSKMESKFKKDPSKSGEFGYAIGALNFGDFGKRNVIRDARAKNKPPVEKPGRYTNMTLSTADKMAMQDVKNIRNALSRIDDTRKIIDKQLADGKRFLDAPMRKNLDKAEAKLKDDRRDIIGRLRSKSTYDTKESVLEEIYEAELCGDITPEEREILIDYMDY